MGKTRKTKKKTRAKPAGTPEARPTRVWSAILLAALAAMVGVVLAALESMKAAAL
jgi:hypothetical protein